MNNMLNLDDLKNNIAKFITSKDKIIALKYISHLFFQYFRKKKYNRILQRTAIDKAILYKNLGNLNYNKIKIKELFLENTLLSFTKDNQRFQRIKLMNELFPEFKNYVLNNAARLLNNKFEIFGIFHQFHNDIDWNYSFMDNFSWPYINSKEIGLDLSRKITDIKYNLEFNRHSFLFDLALAYYFTGNELYTEKILDLLLDWIKKNPVHFNLSWFGIIDTSIRVISWLFMLSLIKNSNALVESKLKTIFESLFQQTYYIIINLEKHTLNHYTCELFAIYLFSICFKGFKSSDRWHTFSLKRLKNQLKLQTLLDGVNIERSINYHRFVLEIFTLFYLINPSNFSEKEKYLLNKMYSFLCFSIKPDLSLPLVGDSDDAHIIPKIFFYQRNNNESHLSLLNIGSLLFKRGDLKYINQSLSPLFIFFFGLEGYKIFTQLESFKPKSKYYYFHTGGYFIARSEYEENPNYIFVDMADFSPFGSHDHFDFANIIYSYRGKPILVDSGTFKYNVSLKMRNLFKGAQAHNLLYINNSVKLKSTGIFNWNYIPKILKKCIISKDHYQLVISHKIYKGFKINRAILANKNLDCIKITDTIIPLKKSLEKTVKIFFHFYYNTKIDLKDNRIIINDNLILRIKLNKGIIFKIRKAEYEYSSRYGDKISAPLIIVEFDHKFTKKIPISINSKLWGIYEIPKEN